MRGAWGSYPETVLQFPDARVTIDLRRAVSPHAVQALAGVGLARPFAVVTACNPLGRPLDEASNQRLNSVFSNLVTDRYPDARPAHGASPDGTHVEQGWAIPAPLEECTGLAARFLQNAVYWYDGVRFSIVPVLAEGSPLFLPEGGPRP